MRATFHFAPVARRTVVAAFGYFAAVFAAGFVLGTVRVLWAVPALGARLAELAEMPLMLAVIVIAAHRTRRRLGPDASRGACLAAGLLALALLLAVEFGVVLGLRGLSLQAYWASRDPLSSAVYFVLLAVFGVLPAVLRGR